MTRSLKKTVLILLLLTCAACSSVGPSTVPQDQFNYNGAIAGAAQEQMLMNMVRLRYSETPTFLKVSSVISQYTRAGRVSAGVGANTSFLGDDTASATGIVEWADKPTITYVPVAGQDFANGLLTPLQPYRLFEIMETGWPAELVFRTSVQKLNGLSNDVARPSRRKEADAQFLEMFYLWRVLGQADVVRLRRKTTGDGTTHTVLYVERTEGAEIESELQRFREILGLNPEIDEFDLIYGKTREPNQIAVLTGSIWDIMLSVAWQIDVPEDHIQAGRTATSFSSNRESYMPPIRVRFADEPPESAFVSVFAHDHWFYIDQNDRQSKRVFSFLQLLLNLAQSDVGGVAPVVTISN